MCIWNWQSTAIIANDSDPDGQFSTFFFLLFSSVQRVRKYVRIYSENYFRLLRFYLKSHFAGGTTTSIFSNGFFSLLGNYTKNGTFFSMLFLIQFQCKMLEFKLDSDNSTVFGISAGIFLYGILNLEKCILQSNLSNVHL